MKRLPLILLGAALPVLAVGTAVLVWTALRWRETALSRVAEYPARLAAIDEEAE